jgi:hypothetical protein
MCCFCRSFATLRERINALGVRPLPLINPARGAALLGDYAYSANLPEVEERPSADAAERSRAAGDALAILLHSHPEALALRDSDCAAAAEMQLTQAVGRTRTGNVSHLATVTWAADGTPSLRFHRNTLLDMANKTILQVAPARSAAAGAPSPAVAPIALQVSSVTLRTGAHILVRCKTHAVRRTCL